MGTYFEEIKGWKVAVVPNASEMVSFGVVVLAGSNFEQRDQAGISHFVEHMCFKGTLNRNWEQITKDFAKNGASQNAYTSNTEVCYHATCPKTELSNVAEILMDMFFNSTFPEAELERERGVITEEKKMYEDDPWSSFNAIIGNKFFCWEKGHETIGEFETIANIRRENIVEYMSKNCNPSNVLFICCGDIDPKPFCSFLATLIPDSHKFRYNAQMNDVSKDFFSDIFSKPEKVKLVTERENIVQSQVKMITQGISFRDKSRLNPWVVAIGAIGGGMYSRLFSRIREELGLCYSVGMCHFSMAYPDYTINQLYGYTSPEKVSQFIDECEKVLRDVQKNGITQEMFDCAKTDYIATILRSTETSMGRMHYVMRRYLMGNTDSVDDMINEARAVQIGDCNDIAREMLDTQYNWAVMNPKA